MSELRNSQPLKIPMKEIELATENFKTEIGKGGFGSVYKGELSISGKPTTVAVKRLNKKFGQGLKEFLTEINLLSGNRHDNLISLLGFCDEEKEMILVYEYAERGSVDKYVRCSDADDSLTWLKRLKICVDAARGLDHLHNHIGNGQTIIHRDIKSSNILVDQNWVAKISDLGLSKLDSDGPNITNVCGTPGYIDPTYENSCIVKKESDVYSFGMVLFEVLCGRPCYKKQHDGLQFSADLAKDYYQKEKLVEIIDPRLWKQMSEQSMKKFSAIAYGCVQNDQSQRPSMDSVVEELAKALEIQIKHESGTLECSNAKEDQQQMPTDHGETFERSEYEFFLQSEVNGKKHLMISVMEILFNSPKMKPFHLKPSAAESRFPNVMELLPQQVFRITYKIESEKLSPFTAYACYLVFKLSKNCRGLHCPVKVRDLLQHKNKGANILYFRFPAPFNKHDAKFVPNRRKDGWMEVMVWKFNSIVKLENNLIPLNLKLKTYEGTMSGLIICGLDFRPM